MQSSRMILEILIFEQPAKLARLENIASYNRSDRMDDVCSHKKKPQDDIPPFIQALAETVGLPPDYVNDLFKTDHAYYNKISYLSAYLENNKNHQFPSLTFKEAQDTTPQEALNLHTTYCYVEAGYLSLEQAKNLPEEERMMLLKVGNPDVLKTEFEQYQKYLNYKNIVENKKSEAMDSEQAEQISTSSCTMSFR